MAGFGITFATLLVIVGRMGDLYGHRKIFYIGLIGFVLASLGAALSISALMLNSMRALQGAFGRRHFPVRHRIGGPSI